MLLFPFHQLTFRGALSAQILNKVRDVDPNNSEAIKEVLTSFFQNVTKHTEVNCYQWLEALEHILIRYKNIFHYV